MPYYDVYGTFHFENMNIELFTDSTYVDNQNMELFAGPTCVDNPNSLCSTKATGYKTCFKDGKSEECCNTCNQFKTCEDKPDCSIKVNDPNNYKENGLCKDSFWDKCCASCNNRLNNYNDNSNENNNACIDRLPNCDQRTDQCNNIDDVRNYYCCKTCSAKNQQPTQPTQPQPTQPEPTQQPTQPNVDLLPDCRKYANSCNQNNLEGSLMNYFCNNTCNNKYMATDKMDNCNGYINQCNNNNIIGSALRNHYCSKTCNN